MISLCWHPPNSETRRVNFVILFGCEEGPSVGNAFWRKVTKFTDYVYVRQVILPSLSFRCADSNYAVFSPRDQSVLFKLRLLAVSAALSFRPQQNFPIFFFANLCMPPAGVTQVLRVGSRIPELPVQLPRCLDHGSPPGARPRGMNEIYRRSEISKKTTEGIMQSRKGLSNSPNPM